MPPKGSKHVTYKWTPESERVLLLSALKRVEFQPSRAFYTEVTQNLGGEVTVDGVRYCLYTRICQLDSLQLSAF
jgi:hypothetical protein